ncbi:hypothetical protein JCM19233_3072 [Vibrio astriarenae]|nr:hypothetical protein JCM19233_3072 [Vibrio sp. C7]
MPSSALIELSQPLNAAEQAGLDIARRWIDGTDKPFVAPMAQ